MGSDWAYYLFYLTDLEHFLITIHFGVVLCRHIKIITGHIAIDSKKEALYSTVLSNCIRILLPISSLIAVVFWSTYLYDKSFFLNQGYWPVSIYICLHFLNTCFLWLEVARFKISATPQKLLAISLKLIGFLLSYTVFNLLYKVFTNKWVYTVQEKVPLWVQLLLAVPNSLIAIGFDWVFVKCTNTTYDQASPKEVRSLMLT